MTTSNLALSLLTTAVAIGLQASQQSANPEAAEERLWACGSSPPRRPALTPSPELATRLDHRCKQAIALLEELQHPEAQYHRRLESSSSMPHQLPLRALRFAKGLAFQARATGGLLRH